MDITTLISDAKARFSHNSAKAYLKDKYDSKLIVADQGGLWKANLTTIAFLNAFDDDNIIVIDTFDNPVQVNRAQLLTLLTDTYNTVMLAWYKEWKELEGKR
jgi:hypothetical protein